jgi:hypothetical protein
VSDGTENLAAAVVEQAVASAVAAEVSRATLMRQATEEAFWGGTRDEVLRLRQVVADQALQITTLQNRLAEAQRAAHRLEMRQLVDAVSAAVLGGTASLDGYVVSDARVEVKAALEINGGQLAVTADPGALLHNNALSTFDMHLGALPPPLGEPDRSSVLARARTALAALQNALDATGVTAPGRAAVLQAVSDLVGAPGESAGWSPLAAALDGLADAEPAVADQAGAGALAAEAAGVDASSPAIASAADTIDRLAAALRRLPG